MPHATSARGSTAWIVLALIAVANFGNFYVYDSIGPVAELLERRRGFTDTEIGMLNAVYSLPNIVLLVVGGVLVDRLGAGRMMFWTAAVCFAGALLTALAADYRGMVTGRLLFGIGAETFNIATLAGVARFFPARRLALAIAISLALGRAGAFSVDLSPAWFPGVYALGWQPPLLIAAALAGVSLAMAAGYRLIERRDAAPGAESVESATVIPAVAWRDLARFPRAYWLLLALCLVWYAVIFAFRSTFSIKYFQHVHGLDLAAAGTVNGYVFLAALFATPFFGWLCDRTGRYAPLLAFGAMLLPAAIATMATTALSLWVGTVLIGISYSLVPAVMWPLVARIVPQARFGTALGLMWVALNAGIAGANLAAGRLNDTFGASAANAAGYEPMMAFFFAASLAGFALAAFLWRSAGRRVHEIAYNPRP